MCDFEMELIFSNALYMFTGKVELSRNVVT